MQIMSDSPFLNTLIYEKEKKERTLYVENKKRCKGEEKEKKQATNRKE